MPRETLLTWLSRIMFAVAAIAATSLVLEYGFYPGPKARSLLHLLDLVVIAVFIVDALVRFALSRKKLRYLKVRWAGVAILALVLGQLAVVAHLEGRGWLPAFLSTRSVFSLTKGYLIVLQVYLVFLVIGEAVRANRSIASLRIKPARTVIFSFVVIIVLGALLLLTPKACIDSGMSVIDALFTSTSAVCVTGLTVQDTGSYFTGFGHGIILMLIQIGGLGLITLTAFFALFGRGGLGVGESLALRGMMSYENVGQIGRTLRCMIGVTFGFEALGALLLYVSTRADFPSSGEATVASLFHAISAFCNAGLSLYTTSFERYAADVPVNLIMTTLIILGGLGFPVIMNILGRRVLTRGQGRPRSRWSIHTKTVFVMTAALLIIGTLGFFLLEADGVLAGRPLGERFLISYFESVTARTAGFNTVRTSFLALPTIFLLAILMFVGGSPGGTAGGVKTVSLGLVLASIWSMFGGTGRVEIFKRRVSDSIVREALVVVAMGILVVSGGTFFLLIAEDLTMKQVLFEVVSAFGTVGLSTGVTPTLSAAGKVALILIMLTGRIGPLTLALAIGQRREQRFYDYAEEQVVIG